MFEFGCASLSDSSMSEHIVPKNCYRCTGKSEPLREKSKEELSKELKEAGQSGVNTFLQIFL